MLLHSFTEPVMGSVSMCSIRNGLRAHLTIGVIVNAAQRTTSVRSPSSDAPPTSMCTIQNLTSVS